MPGMRSLAVSRHPQCIMCKQGDMSSVSDGLVIGMVQIAHKGKGLLMFFCEGAMATTQKEGG